MQNHQQSQQTNLNDQMPMTGNQQPHQNQQPQMQNHQPHQDGHPKGQNREQSLALEQIGNPMNDGNVQPMQQQNDQTNLTAHGQNQQMQQGNGQRPNIPYLQAGQPAEQGMDANDPLMRQIQKFEDKLNSRNPSEKTCKYCKTQVQSVVTYQVGTGTWLISCILAAMGLCLGCCLIPCCVDDCKDAKHSCPNCSHEIGKSKFIFE